MKNYIAKINLPSGTKFSLSFEAPRFARWPYLYVKIKALQVLRSDFQALKENAARYIDIYEL